MEPREPRFEPHRTARGAVLGARPWNHSAVLIFLDLNHGGAVRTGGSTNSANIGNPVICIFYTNSGCIFKYFAYRLVKTLDERLDYRNIKVKKDFI
jgi:hypothetical protein